MIFFFILGPLLGELKEGRDVTLDDGTVVKASEMVDQATGKKQVQYSIQLALAFL